MKLLWFTGLPLEPVTRQWGGDSHGSGTWMNALLQPLLASGKVRELAIAWAGPCLHGEKDTVIDGVRFYNVPMPVISVVHGIGRGHFQERSLRRFEEIVDEFRPDLIHLHGSEGFFGRLRSEGRVRTPTVLSIQGLLGPSAPYALGDKSVASLLPYMTLGEVLRGFPSLRIGARFRAHEGQERRYLQSVDGILGRTEWDRAHAWDMAPNVPYYHVDEMLREAFFQAPAWVDEQAIPGRIYTTAQITYLKGMHTLVEAMALVRKERPEATLHVGAPLKPTAQARAIRALVRRLGLRDMVRFLGPLSAEEIVREQRQAQVFAYASFMENGCNAVQEAMLVGMPVVCTASGGMTTTVQDEVTGLLTRAGDAPLLAWKILELLRNREKRVRLGAAARQKALERHAPDTILKALFHAYEETLRRTHG